MTELTVSHRVDAPPGDVRALLGDVGPFMRAAGFDEVAVDGDRVRIAQGVGLATIELELEVVDDPDVALRYDQVDGIFESMTTRYEVEGRNDGTQVTATTEFTLGGIPGTVLDETIVRRQRTRELEAQFAYLDERLGESERTCSGQDSR